MALFKTDMAIGEHYAQLCNDPVSGQHLFNIIDAEYQQTSNAILIVTNSKTLIQDNPALALSLSRRDPYLEPLKYIQTILLKRYRDGQTSELDRARWRDPLLRTISAISTGLRNTG